MSLALLKELNRFRANPKAYGLEMRELAKCYANHTITFPSGACIETLEGISALHGLLDDLSMSSPLPAFTYSLPMSRACKLHVEDLQAHNFCSHIGTDGSTPEQRVSCFGRHREQCGENIAFVLTDPREMLWHMLIDDGCPERGHRGNLLNMDFGIVGLARGDHPSMNHCAVIVFVDHFKPKRSDAAEKMASLAATIKTAKGSGKWSDIVSSLRPDHLRCSAKQEESVNRLVQPNRNVWERGGGPPDANPAIHMRSLIPSEPIDPSKVRACVHRLDGDFDDCITEQDVLKQCRDMPCLAGEAVISPLDLREMFDDILMTRAPQFRFTRAISWSELYNAMEVNRLWGECVEISCSSSYDGSDKAEYASVVGRDVKRRLVFDRVELEWWIRDISRRFAHYPSLHKIPAANTGNPAPIPVEDMRAFLRSCVPNIADHVTFRQEVLPFFQLPAIALLTTLDIAAGKESVRHMWVYRTQRFRANWIRICKAVGCNPLCPVPEHLQTRKAQTAPIGPMSHVMEPRPLTLSRAVGKNIANTRKTNKVTIRPMRVPVSIRSAPEDRDSVVSNASAPSPARELPWEEKRRLQEERINGTLNAGDSALTRSSSAQCTVTVDARRRFLASMQKQERASEEARFLCRDHDSSGGLRPTRSIGSGAFSLEAPGGTGGHFHSSVSQHQCGRSGIYPVEQEHDKQLVVEWNGSHIDHTKSGYVFEDTKWCSLTKAEKAKAFTTYPNPRLRHYTPRKTEVANERKDVHGPWQEWKEFEHRADVPMRHGRFGRRKFDPQVGEKAVTNAHNIGEIETKPIEDYNWQMERYDNYVIHHVPEMHGKKFDQNLPKASAPKNWESFTTRTPLLDCVVGDRLHSQIGWGQTRHSDIHRDMKYSIRPLGVSQMDKLIDVGPISSHG